jgi:hypothetical protein
VAEVKVSTSGSNDLRRLGRDLQKAGAVTLRKELIKGLQRAGNIGKAAVPMSARSHLPGSGGIGRGTSLGEYVADLGVVAKVAMSGKNAGIRITGSKSKARAEAHRRRQARKNLKRKPSRQRAASTALRGQGLVDLNAINRGRVKAPTFGHRPWHVQAVKPGFFDDAMTGVVAQAARQAAVDAVRAIERDIAGG